MRKLKAFKRSDSGPYNWRPPNKGVAAFYRFSAIEEVQTPDGVMVVVRMDWVRDLMSPGDNEELASLVGTLDLPPSPRIDMNSVDIYYWRDKFWIKARGTDKVEYYRDKKWLIYAIELNNPDDLLGQLKMRDFG